MRRATGLLIAAAVSITAPLADVRGRPETPSFTPEEMALVKRDPRLLAAAQEHPRHLRCALDAWEGARRAAAPRPEPCPTELPPEPGRASTEGPFDLLQILKEAAGGGGGTKR